MVVARLSGDLLNGEGPASGAFFWWHQVVMPYMRDWDLGRVKMHLIYSIG